MEAKNPSEKRKSLCIDLCGMQQQTYNGIVKDYFMELCLIFEFFKLHQQSVEVLNEIL